MQRHNYKNAKIQLGLIRSATLLLYESTLLAATFLVVVLVFC